MVGPPFVFDIKDITLGFKNENFTSSVAIYIHVLFIVVPNRRGITKI